MSGDEALVSVRNVSKRFGATRALSDVSVAFHPGRVHGLVGENGAGKSTLGRILLGIHAPDRGQLVLDGSPTKLSGPDEAASYGLVGVAQELSLLPAMRAVDNIVLGSEECIGPFVSDRGNRKRVESLVAQHGLQVPLDENVGSLSVADQQKVEILRALGRRSRLVVFDEPTARLASHEADELRRTVRELANRGVAVVYVSHFLNEVLSVSDTVTVMRDGCVVRTAPAADETYESLVEGMTGRSIGDAYPPKPPQPGDDAPVVLRAKGLSRAGEFSDISFSIKKGEILGLAGLVGAGRSEVAHAVYGATRASAGTVEVSGSRLLGTVSDGLSNGISLIPESRRDQGLVVGLPVRDNTTLPHLQRFIGRLGIRVKQEEAAAGQVIQEAGVRAESLSVPVGTLSGGNQQKVLFARAMLGQPQLFIADEPTRGVDVGSKRAIYDVIGQLARSGCAVLLVSSELEDVVEMSHRVLVMRFGRIVAEFAGEELTEANILNAAFDTEHLGNRPSTPDSQQV
ncbi:sugar ABC transporter ATP-binding protein [Candidatus Poriferisocius sp.]|uniref:sugar ABC transporter ATP-binding protein n=1 Tax=Candidatus Poriferisocius sp. TaxID=3101276 RepID=UPI003B01425C